VSIFILYIFYNTMCTNYFLSIKKYTNSYGKDTQKIKRLEKTLDDLFDNGCELKAPVLWPAEPLKNW
jgi:hypothetical protein